MSSATLICSFRDNGGELGLKTSQLLRFQPKQAVQTFDKHKLGLSDSINIWQVAPNSNAPPAKEGKTGSSQLYLIEEVFKHKVVVVVAGGQLHILQTGKQRSIPETRDYGVNTEAAAVVPVGVEQRTL